MTAELGPTRIAERLRSEIRAIEEKIAIGLPCSERSQLNQQLHAHRRLLAWATTRIGYGR